MSGLTKPQRTARTESSLNEVGRYPPQARSRSRQRGARERLGDTPATHLAPALEQTPAQALRAVQVRAGKDAVR
jgi:hypothetical protein